MFDTLIQHYFVHLPAIEKSSLWLHHTGSKCGETKYRYYTYSVNGLPTSVKATYYPSNNHTDVPLLIIEIGSVPKLIYGNNYQLAMDMTLNIRTITSTMRSIPCLGRIDAAKGLVERIDFCNNHQVGDKVSDYLSALAKVTCTKRGVISYSNRRKLPHAVDTKVKGSQINGVVFECDSTSASFYDKFTECRDDNARGLLRMEKRVKGNTVIGKLIGIPHPTLGDITVEIADAAIKKELEFLGIAGEFVSEKNELKQLVEKVGAVKGKKLYSHLSVFNLHPGKTVKELSELLGVTTGTIQTWKKQLVKAGISISMAPTTVKLPRLTPGFMPETQKNHNKFLSDTGEAVTGFTEQELVDLNARLKSMADKKPVEAVDGSLFEDMRTVVVAHASPIDLLTRSDVSPVLFANLSSCDKSWMYQLTPITSSDPWSPLWDKTSTLHSSQQSYRILDPGLISVESTSDGDIVLPLSQPVPTPDIQSTMLVPNHTSRSSWKKDELYGLYGTLTDCTFPDCLLRPIEIDGKEYKFHIPKGNRKEKTPVPIVMKRVMTENKPW